MPSVLDFPLDILSPKKSRMRPRMPMKAYSPVKSSERTGISSAKPTRKMKPRRGQLYIAQRSFGSSPSWPTISLQTASRNSKTKKRKLKVTKMHLGWSIAAATERERERKRRSKLMPPNKVRTANWRSNKAKPVWRQSYPPKGMQARKYFKIRVIADSFHPFI